ncbi:MAG: AAA family ATPase [Thermoguttaceae bacterium]|nr:AAA family ATPase [Thermoguttaceae bacterium]
MYQAYWQLTERPFENSLDLRFYYPSQCHQAALLKLRYALETQAEAALLAAGPGMGKTLLVGMLGHLLGERFGPWIQLGFPQMRLQEVLEYVADELEGEKTERASASIAWSIRRIERLLDKLAGQGRHPILVVEDAHLITEAEHWEELRLLMNFRAGQRVGWTLLLVAQPPLLPLLERMPAWEDRLAIKCLLRPFEPMDTAAYVAHRLKVAGASRDLFEPDALAALHQLSHGVPRRINRLADLALLLGYAESQEIILAEHVQAVAEEMFTFSS